MQGDEGLARARDVLADREIAAAIVDDADAAPEPGRVLLAVAQLERGFELEDARLAVLTESEFYGRTIGGDSRVVKKLASKRRNVVDPLQLTPGDHVVHATHGPASAATFAAPAASRPARRKKQATNVL